MGQRYPRNNRSTHTTVAMFQATATWGSWDTPIASPEKAQSAPNQGRGGKRQLQLVLRYDVVVWEKLRGPHNSGWAYPVRPGNEVPCDKAKI